MYQLKWPTPFLADRSDAERLRYWTWVMEAGLARKDKELAAGLNKYGTKLPGVRPSTRKRRRSAMTVTGKGDPDAPYLSPGHELSRVRSLLAGRAYANRALFYWRFDVHSDEGNFLKILQYHAKRGKRYDVIGLSPKGQQWVKRQADKKWAEYIKSDPIPSPPPANAQRAELSPLPMIKSGRQTTKYIDMATDTSVKEVEAAIKNGNFSGWRTAKELEKLMRSSGDVAKTVVRNPSQTAPVVNKGVNNIVLQHTWRVAAKPVEQAGLFTRAKTWWRDFRVKFGL